MTTSVLDVRPADSILAETLSAVEASLPDLVETWGLDSFPASDPPSNW